MKMKTMQQTAIRLAILVGVLVTGGAAFAQSDGGGRGGGRSGGAGSAGGKKPYVGSIINDRNTPSHNAPTIYLAGGWSGVGRYTDTAVSERIGHHRPVA